MLCILALRRNTSRITRPIDGVEDHALRPWQETLRKKLEEPPGDREVIFVVDYVGNQGKTWFAKWHCANNDTSQFMTPGKVADMAYELSEDKKVLFINVTRQKTETFQYSFVESVKDGMVFSPKYESRMKRLSKMHVVVLMNQDPDTTLMSQDRFNIIKLY